MGKLDGKVAIVTGGAMGNGFGAALALAKNGAQVVLVDISDRVFEAAQSLDKNAVGYKMDVSDFNDVSKVFQSIAEKFGKIDILVNNAGVAVIVPFLEMSDEIRDRHFNVNIKGVWNCTKAALPHMLQANYGKIVNLSSVTGTMVADVGETAYAITKGGIWAFTKALAMEVAKNNITVNAVCPGYILTPMVQKVAEEVCPENPQSVINGIAEPVPMGRLGTIEELGDLVAFLASDESRYITGTQVVIDGGSTLPETFGAVH